MTPKKGNKLKAVGLKNIKFPTAKNLNLEKLKIKPIHIVEATKNKIGNYYINLKNEWEKNKKNKEKKRILEEKKKKEKQRKNEKKEKLEKAKEEKSKI